MRILLQWIALRRDPPDPCTAGAENQGPTLQLLSCDRYKGYFDRVYLFGDDKSMPLAERMSEFLCAGEGYPEAEAVHIDVDDVTDYGLLYSRMTDACGRIAKQLAGQEPEFHVHVSPGTPQASTVWFVMAKAGDIEAKLLQTVPPDIQKETGLPPVREVDLDLGHFPLIQKLENENFQLRKALRETVSLGRLRTRSRRVDFGTF